MKIPDYYSSEDHGQGWEGKAELNVAIAYTTGVSSSSSSSIRYSIMLVLVSLGTLSNWNYAQVFHQPYIEMLDTLTIDMV